ncbi:ZIP family metal transporter [Candidatus Nomurabacteria bacterium]|nr:ZIP family metal transporter [Candidatus Nomurabacteria bacterium]
MFTVWLYALISVLAVGLVSLVGIFALSLNELRLRNALFLLVALSAGALFGDVLIHLLPEIFEGKTNVLVPSLAVLAGILLFFILEKFLHWHHSHGIDNERDECEHIHIKPFGRLNLIADGFHNFLDGITIGISFLVNPTVGFATTLAVILHEIPQEMGDFGILLHAGYNRRQALYLNLLSALTAVLGTIIALALGSRIETFGTTLLPIAAGGFLYLAGSDLVPELHRTTDPKKSSLQLIAMLIGIALMAMLTLVE